MAVPKAIYFFFFAAVACFAPYLALYLEGLGMVGGQIGLLTAIQPIVTLFAAPAWGALADQTHQHKRILILSMICSALIALVLTTVHSFGWLALTIALLAVFTAPILPIVDNSVIEQLGARRVEYGKQRVWGSYGFGIAGLVSGAVIANFGMSAMFVCYAGLLGCGVLAARNLVVRQVPIGVKLGVNLGQFIRNRRWLLFMALVFITGAGMAILNNYYMIFFKQLGASDLLLGLALALAILSEIPILLYSDRLLKRFGSRGMLAIGSTVFSIRTLILVLLVTPLQALALQALQGLTFIVVWVAGVEFSSQVAPPGLGATSQGLFGGIFGGLGFACGAVLGGYLYQSFGIRLTFLTAAVGVLLATLIFLILFRPEKRAESA